MQEETRNSISSDPMPTPIEPASSTGGGIDINALGYYLDGWADLVEDRGEGAVDIYDSTAEILKDRYSDSYVQKQTVQSNSAERIKQRDYAITTNRPGATTAIYVGPRGTDLYISWRTYIKPVLRRDVLVIIGIAALFLGAFAAGGDVTSAMFVIITLLTAILGFAIVTAAGRLLKGNSFAYFYEEPTVYDAEDITAMSMAAHKSLIRALDKEGIDVSKLRLKQNFVGGRRDEAI